MLDFLNFGSDKQYAQTDESDFVLLGLMMKYLTMYKTKRTPVDQM